jgi:hypothetical protein
MTTTRTDPATLPWIAGTEMYGSAAFHEGQPILELKTLSDRRTEGGGVAYLLRASPPEGKLIKIVAVARSDEHIWNLSGGRANKAGLPAAGSGGYSLNPEGQPHSAMIASETTALVIYTGEPDEIKSIEIIDIEPALGNSA